MALKWEDADTAKRGVETTRKAIRQLYARNLGTPSDGWNEADRKLLAELLKEYDVYAAMLEADVEKRR